MLDVVVLRVAVLGECGHMLCVVVESMKVTGGVQACSGGDVLMVIRC